MSDRFTGVAAGWGKYDLTSMLFRNLKWFIDWSLLHEGAFTAIEVGASGFHGGIDRGELLPVEHKGYLTGQVWNGVGREWVWESGVGVADPPVRVSGVLVDGVFKLPGDPEFGHRPDYANGRIVFDLPQDTGLVVEADYWMRDVFVAEADNEDFRTLTLDAFPEFFLDDMASSAPNRESQAHLPAVFIDQRGGRGAGLQLGGGQVKTREVLLHIFADNPDERNMLMDWLDFQNRKVFVGADLNKAPPVFDRFGDVGSGITNWPDLVTAYPWRKLRFSEGRSEKLASLNPEVFRARVEWTVEIDMPGV